MYNKSKDFQVNYNHGISGKQTFVNGSVSVDADSGIFNVDITRGHDTMGRGNMLNLPKMRATLEMKQQILDYLEQEFSMN